MVSYKDYHHLILEGFNEPQNQCACLAEHYQKWINLRFSLPISPRWRSAERERFPAAGPREGQAASR
jgi:hypothetical protein